MFDFTSFDKLYELKLVSIVFVDLGIKIWINCGAKRMTRTPLKSLKLVF